MRTVQRWWKRTLSAYIPTTEPIVGEYKAWHQDTEWLNFRDRFLWQRLHLGIWIATICVFTFILRDILQQIFHFQESAKITQEIKNLALTINSCIFLSLLGCLALYKTNVARRYPELLFLCLSFSVTLVEQFVATYKGFALPDQLAWIVAFLTQATLIPVRWYLHLGSQLGVVIYYFVVNTALGLKLPPPFSHNPTYTVTMILLIFWVCFICDLAVYLYEKLQRSEFYARKELEFANQKLTVTEAKYRNIFENAVEGIFQSTADGRYITANPALARIYGYSLPEEVTASFTDIEHQLYVESNRRADFVRLIAEYGSVSEFESQIYRRDGSIVWISEKAYAVHNSQGELLYYEGMIEDITKRKQAEEALQEQFIFLQVLIDTIPAPVYYKNTQGLYLGCNKAFKESLGLKKEEILGKSVDDLTPKDLADKDREADMRLFQLREVQIYESVMVYADDSKHDVIFYKATFSKADGTLGGLVGVILDISERKRTEEALRVFFHAVSHDLRNPVLGTLMVLRNLLNSRQDKSSQSLIPVSRFILERMEQSSDRQLNLINSLMEAHVSEVQGIVLQLQAVELLNVAEAAIADLKPMLLENQAVLINQISADLPKINADPTQLWRVFSNLIVNAVKHNPPGLTININAIVSEDKIYCSVTDNGVGMSQKQSDRLFDLYFRGAKQRNSLSLGLGLYLCKQIITAHGGEIGVKSALDKGATFWFTLPIAKEKVKGES